MDLAGEKKGDLIIYNTELDFLVFPRLDLKIESANKRMSFSNEHYTNLSNHFFELNIILDGNRIKFISSSQKNGFKIILKWAEVTGFNVLFNKIKIK